MSSVQAVDTFKNFQAPPAATSSSANTAPVESVSSASSDTAFASLKNNKKAIIGGLAALTLAGAGIAYAIKRQKVPEEVKNALADVHKLKDEVTHLMQGPVAKITQEIDDITKKMQSKYNEVLELFNKGDEIAPDGTVLRKINDNIMSEFSKDGKTLIRQTEFADSMPYFIEEFIVGTNKRNIYEFLDGKPDFCQEGYELLAGHTLKIAKRLNFSDGKPNLYTEEWQRFADGTRKEAKQLSINVIDKPGGKPDGYLEVIDGKTNLYEEGIEMLADGVRKAAKQLRFDFVGTPKYYQKGYEKFADGSQKAAKWLDFKNGKPVSYEEGYERLADGTQFVDNWLDFVDGKWIKARD